MAKYCNHIYIKIKKKKLVQQPPELLNAYFIMEDTEVLSFKTQREKKIIIQQSSQDYNVVMGRGG